MKGIVVNQNNDEVIIFTKDGQFIKEKNKYHNCTIGEEIIFENKYLHKTKLKTIRKYGFRYAAAILLCVLITSLGYSVYAHPVGYINIDINPSIQLAYNRFHRIVSIKGNNEDGESMVSSLEAIKGKKIEESIANVVIVAKKEHYMDEKPAVTLTFVGDNNELDEEQILDELNKEQYIEDSVQWMVINKTEKQYEEEQKDKKLLIEEQQYKEKNEMSSNKKKHKTEEKVKLKGNENSKLPNVKSDNSNSDDTKANENKSNDMRSDKSKSIDKEILEKYKGKQKENKSNFQDKKKKTNNRKKNTRK